LTKRRALHGGIVVASLLLSAFLGYLAVRNVNWSATWAALRESNYWWVVPALFALAAAVALRVLRWRVLFRREQRPPYGPLTKSTLIGLLFNVVLPGRVGEAARIVALKSYAGTSAIESTATIVVERLIDVLTLLALLFIFEPWFPTISWLKAAGFVALAGIGVMVVLIAVAVHLYREPSPRLMRSLARLPVLTEARLEHATANLSHGLTAIRRPAQAAAAVGWTVGSWFVLALSFWFLTIGFHLHLSPLSGLLVVIATSLVFILPTAPGAAGVFEAAGLAATSAYGVPTSQALAYVLVLHLLNLLPYILAGLFVLTYSAPKLDRGVSTATEDEPTPAHE
jgi:uncharacterized protein (TIRG00374 family)